MMLSLYCQLQDDDEDDDDFDEDDEVCMTHGARPIGTEQKFTNDG